jgi:ribosomal 50S subunit-recycling heat shock protein
MDLFLRMTGVFKTRTIAAKACKSGIVTLNGSPAKVSSEVRENDAIQAVRPDGTLQSWRVLKIPTGTQIPKKDRGIYIAAELPGGETC